VIFALGVCFYSPHTSHCLPTESNLRLDVKALFSKCLFFSPTHLRAIGAPSQATPLKELRGAAPRGPGPHHVRRPQELGVPVLGVGHVDQSIQRIIVVVVIGISLITFGIWVGNVQACRCVSRQIAGGPTGLIISCLRQGQRERKQDHAIHPWPILSNILVPTSQPALTSTSSHSTPARRPSSQSRAIAVGSLAKVPHCDDERT